MQASDKTSLWQQLMINQALELDSPMTECANQTAQLLSWCCPRIQGSKQCCWTHTSVWLTPKAYTKLRAQNLRQHMLLVPAGGASLCMCSGYFICLTWVLTCYSWACVLSRIWLLVTPWTVALQPPLSMEFSRQEYWSGLPFPPPRDLPDPGNEPVSFTSPALAGRLFTTSTTWATVFLGMAPC